MSLKLLTLSCVIFAVYANDFELTCPPPTLIPVCEVTCKSDHKCHDHTNDLCCPTACGGTLCQRGVTMRKKYEKEKKGICPVKPKGRWICSNMCSDDSDCSKQMKCCKNRCGAKVCMDPATESEEDDYLDLDSNEIPFK